MKSFARLLDTPQSCNITREKTEALILSTMALWKQIRRFDRAVIFLPLETSYCICVIGC